MRDLFFGGDDEEENSDEHLDSFVEQMEEMIEEAYEESDMSIEESLTEEQLDQLDEGYRNNQERRVNLDLDMNELNANLGLIINEYYQVRHIDDYYTQSIRGVLRENLRAFAEQEGEDIEVVCRELGLPIEEIFPAREDDAGIEE